MKNSKIILPVAFLFLCLNSCQQSEHKESEYALEAGEAEPAVTVDSKTESSEAPLSSTAATHQDPEHQFIRTADLSMEVENVYKSTTNIENKLAQIGGFVTESNLESHIHSNEIFPIDSDSAKEVKKYTVRNTMTIRVPQRELGSFLISLGDEMKFLHFRNVSAEDVSLSFVIAELEKDRLNKTSDKLDRINNESGKISDKQDIVNDIDEKQSQINQNKISNLKLKDDVAYSSVSLLLTEKEKIAETIVINTKSYDHKYRPEFWHRAGNSVKDGFYFFQTLFIGFLYLWPLWIFAAIIFLMVKFYTKKMRAS